MVELAVAVVVGMVVEHFVGVVGWVVDLVKGWVK